MAYNTKMWKGANNKNNGRMIPIFDLLCLPNMGIEEESRGGEKSLHAAMKGGASKHPEKVTGYWDLGTAKRITTMHRTNVSKCRRIVYFMFVPGGGLPLENGCWPSCYCGR
jgi:hypothetical protein